MNTPDPNDTSFYEFTATPENFSVQSGSVSVHPPQTWGWWSVARPEGAAQPIPGDTLRVYYTGDEIRGFIVNGTPWTYATDAEVRERRRQYAAELVERQKTEYAEGRAEREARVAALPPEFQVRVRHFELHGTAPWDILPYEIAVLQAAAAYAETPDERVMAPFIDSGNQYAFAKNLAQVLTAARADDPHGFLNTLAFPAALTPLCGRAASLGLNAEAELARIRASTLPEEERLQAAVSVTHHPDPMTEAACAELERHTPTAALAILARGARLRLSLAAGEGTGA